MSDEISTSAEAAEAAVLPCVHEVHADPEACAGLTKVPEKLQKPDAAKSPARWAYERLILYIQNFEQQLDAEHEVAMGFTGGNTGVLRIEGMGYFDPDIITYYGSEPDGSRTQLVQHVSQLNVMLRAVPKAREEEPANRIGFRLASDLQQE
ncbi:MULTISPECIES: DUF6173 family protein [unclassified Leisingera]|uniref:DUF6173 family protein n=1 Tax=unclassified Leisingera TaxID=2614906 RepID=UPI0002EECAE3|nr:MULTISPECIES: DUF6173 family protein [unclassified Leisingera]NVK14096.1 hypothetical protein [Paracoccaceae bacterium]KIC24611.1 hypothetical protein RA23_08625 [Leisingera sp. ANG-S3]KIC31733.1 hypothetical protein RA25_16690 [Leisingera sp. ANG-S5]KIC55533.1 hypothetical protein RA22_01985 [Leisingera sp. ANG-S]KID09265.1 hypothetical protein GC1_11370 [Leisingera sp. ANG1]